MKLNWDLEIDQRFVSSISRILGSRTPTGTVKARRGLEATEAPTSTVLNRTERLERLRDGLVRLAMDTSADLKPNEEITTEVVKGAATALEKIDDPQARFSFRERAGLEAVILTDGTRPSLTIKDGFVDLDRPEIGEWREPFIQYRQAMEKVIAAVGRVNIPVRPDYAGTCFAIAPGFVITNRHVLEAIAQQSIDGSWALNWPNETTLDFIGEDGATRATKQKILSVVFAGQDPINRTINFDHLDAAVLAVEVTEDFPAAIALEADKDAVGESRDLYVVGFPGRPYTWLQTGTPAAGHETSSIMASVFRWKFGVKKLAPGRVETGPGDLPGDHKSWVFSHDASTLGGNSGSAIVDLGIDGGRIIGLHFGGVAREQNWAHAVAKIREQVAPTNLTWI